MRTPDFFFANSLAPCISYEAQIPDSNCIFHRTPHAFYVSVPSLAPFASNPTKDLLDRLRDLKKMYSQTWIPGSTAPTELAFQNAKDFISTLPLTSIPTPAIHVASDGEVNFQWSGSNFKIDLGFYGNGKFSYYGLKTGYQPVFGDDIPVTNGAPKSLLNIASAA